MHPDTFKGHASGRRPPGSASGLGIDLHGAKQPLRDRTRHVAALYVIVPPLVLGALGLHTARADAPLEAEFTRGALATADFGDARLRGAENRLSLRGPATPAGDGEFRWALDYAYQRYEYSGLPSRNRDLHRLEVPLNWQSDVAYSWTTELRPVVASSSNVFKELWSRGSSDDLMLHGGVTRLSVPEGEGWGWRLGVARDDAFGQEHVYPVVAVLHEVGRLRATYGWPETQLAWQAMPQLELGAEVAPAGARWHVVSDERDGAEFFYELRAWRAGGKLQWRPASRWQVTARAGVEFDRRHRFEDDAGARVNRAADDAAYAELSVAYRWLQRP
jgi:hypothetical protein